MCQFWALSLDPSSFGSAAKQAHLRRGRDCIPAWYFSSSLISAFSASFSVMSIIVVLLEHTSQSPKGNMLLYCTVAFKTVRVCLTLGRRTHNLILSSQLTFIVLTWQLTAWWPVCGQLTVLLINMTSACFVCLCVAWSSPTSAPFVISAFCTLLWFGHSWLVGPPLKPVT